MARAISCCSSVTSLEEVQTVMPWPICPGVLGIDRTTDLCFSPALIFLMFAPAMIERTRASVRMLLRPFITSVRRCGFTDSTTTSAWEAAEALSVDDLILYFLLKSAPRSSRGPQARMFSGLANFLRNNPAIMASAITPGPINAIFLSNMTPPLFPLQLDTYNYHAAHR